MQLFSLFSPAQGSIQLFMWQPDILGSLISKQSMMNSSWTVLTFLVERLMFMKMITRTRT